MKIQEPITRNEVLCGKALAERVQVGPVTGVVVEDDDAAHECLRDHVLKGGRGRCVVVGVDESECDRHVDEYAYRVDDVSGDQFNAERFEIPSDGGLIPEEPRWMRVEIEEITARWESAEGLEGNDPCPISERASRLRENAVVPPR